MSVPSASSDWSCCCWLWSGYRGFARLRGRDLFSADRVDVHVVIFGFVGLRWDVSGRHILLVVRWGLVVLIMLASGDGEGRLAEKRPWRQCIPGGGGAS